MRCGGCSGVGCVWWGGIYDSSGTVCGLYGGKDQFAPAPALPFPAPTGILALTWRHTPRCRQRAATTAPAPAPSSHSAPRPPTHTHLDTYTSMSPQSCSTACSSVRPTVDSGGWQKTAVGICGRGGGCIGGVVSAQTWAGAEWWLAQNGRGNLWGRIGGVGVRCTPLYVVSWGWGGDRRCGMEPEKVCVMPLPNPHPPTNK